jgi:hypothetical protein
MQSWESRRRRGRGLFGLFRFSSRKGRPGGGWWMVLLHMIDVGSDGMTKRVVVLVLVA